VSAGIETTKKSKQEMTIYKTTTQEKQREQGYMQICLEVIFMHMMRIFFIYRKRKGAEEKISILRGELAPFSFCFGAITLWGKFREY